MPRESSPTYQSLPMIHGIKSRRRRKLCFFCDTPSFLPSSETPSRGEYLLFGSSSRQASDLGLDQLCHLRKSYGDVGTTPYS